MFLATLGPVGVRVPPSLSYWLLPALPHPCPSLPTLLPVSFCSGPLLSEEVLIYWKLACPEVTQETPPQGCHGASLTPIWRPLASKDLLRPSLPGVMGGRAGVGRLFIRAQRVLPSACCPGGEGRLRLGTLLSQECVPGCVRIVGF